MSRISLGACLIWCLVLLLLANIPRRAVAYSLNGYSWPSGSQIAVHLQLSRPSGALQDGSVSWDASAADALDIWNQHIDAVKFAVDSPVGPSAGDGANEVFFSSTIYGDTWPASALAVTLNYSNQGSGVFHETDVIFNDNLKWDSYRGPIQGSGPTGTYDLHRVALHEFGHILGLDHPDQHGQSVVAIMNSIISDLDHLSDDDINGAQFLYGVRITSALSLTVSTNESLSYQITATNHPTSFEASGLPPGLQINAATGAITGTPTSLGTFQVNVIAHGVPRDVIATLTIRVSNDPHFTNPLTVTGNVGDPLYFPLRTNPSTSNIIFEDPLPPGLQSDNVNQAISGAPIVPGSFNMRISAVTGSGTITGTLHFDIGARIHDFPTFLDLTVRFKYYDTSSQRFYTPPNQLRVDRDEFNRVTVSAVGGLVRIIFQGGGFQPLHPGVYDGAISNGSSSDQTTLDVYDGNSCDQGIGTFTVKEITYGPKATILSFWATFEQHCSAGLQVQHSGEIRYHVDPSDPLIVPMVSGPRSIEVNQGQPISFQFTATNGATDYSAFGLPLGVFCFPTNGNVTGTPTVAGTFAVRLFGTNSVGTGETDMTITVHPGPSRPHSLLNISTRGHVGTGDNIMIGGFIITGSEQKTVVLRGIGPSLPVPRALSDPAMRITFPSGSQIYTDNWLDVYYPIYPGSWQSIVGTGLAPGNRLEPARLYALNPGAYTIGISGVKNTTGIALAEAYDITPFSSSLANISTRARVGSADDVLIGGFIIGGDQPTRIVLRAIGPSLAKYGVGDALSDPMLELYDGNGALFGNDDDWRTYQEQQLIQTGLAPADDRESAMFLSLPPAAYTAIVRGKNDGNGVAVVEVYNLDAN